MKTRSLHALAALTLAAAGLAGCSKEAGAAGPARRVILVTCDTLRADHLGCYGYARPTSPRLDELARESLVFESAWSAAPLTLPSLSALLAGRTPDEIGSSSRSNSLRMPAEVVTLPELARDAGFSTAAFVSSSILARPPAGGGDVGVSQGFEHYDDELGSSERNRGLPERTAGDCTDAVLRWLDARPEDADRFFLWVHYQDPHGPYTPPEAERKLFEQAHADEAELPLSAGHSGSGAIPDYQALSGERRPGTYVDRYDAEIRHFDAELGRLLDRLRARGWLDDALLVVTADHGESLGENGWWFCHGETLQRELLRVPLLVRPPRARALPPRHESALVSYLDLWPTVLEALGLAPRENGGSSLLARALPQARTALSTLGAAGNGRQWSAITDGRWQLQLLGPLAPRLFDLEHDPAGQDELAGAHPELVRSLEDARLRFLARHPAAAFEGVPVEASAARRRALQQFGYTQGDEGEH